MTDRPSFTNQQINTIVPNSKVEAAFLYYSLRPRKQELLSLGATTGVRTPILNKSAFCDLKVSIPPLSLQRRIVDILSGYDDLIEKSQRRIRILETMARALYREWFVEFRFPGHDKIPRVASPLGDIPQGWEVKTVADSFEISGGRYSFAQGIQLLGRRHSPMVRAKRPYGGGHNVHGRLARAHHYTRPRREFCTPVSCVQRDDDQPCNHRFDCH